MTKFKKLFAGIMCLSVSVFSLVSCINDPAQEPLDAIVDVRIQDMQTDAGVRYGIVIYATSNYELKSAKVTGPGTNGEVYELTATADKRQFVFESESGDYTVALPPKGDYSFEITSTSDEKLTGKDVLGDEKLSSIVIKTSTMDNQMLKTTWDKVQGADYYVVRLFSEDKENLLFQSTFLTAEKVEYAFGSSTQRWADGKSPVANTNYVVELLAIKFETGEYYDIVNHIQFITLDSETIMWE